MRTIFNIVWVAFGGLWLAALYAAAGLLACLTIIGIPVGIACLRIAGYALWPFGRTLVDNPDAGAPSLLANIAWVLLAGWWLALGHLTTALAQAATIVGIPLAIANVKLIPVSLFPYGKRIMRVGIGDYRSYGPEIVGPGNPRSRRSREHVVFPG